MAATIPESLRPFLLRPDLLRDEIARREGELERQQVEKSAEAVRVRCAGSLAAFVKAAWHVLNPDEKLIWNWHLDALCLHLEAVTDGRINRLLINIPPGTMKSLIVSVFWPAWEWGPKSRPSLKYVSTSYKDDFVTRDTRRMRNLVLSPWYQLHWPVNLTRAGETSFENDATGFREGYLFRSLTGGRGNRVIIDDPHSTEGAESEAERNRAVRIMMESVPSRLNDLKRDAIVVVMQRLHERDVSGALLAKMTELGYVHLCLPMEFEPDRRCTTPVKTAEGKDWTDPRSYEGELLFPAKFPREEVDKLKASLGSYGTAGQLQQSPSPRSGGLFKRHWFGPEQMVRVVPARVVARTRAWDLAATQKKANNRPSWTAGVRMSRDGQGRFYVEHVKRMQETAGTVWTAIETTAETDPRGTRVHLPKDPGQAGKSQSQQMVKGLARFDVRVLPPTGDKETRATPASVQAEAGNIYIVVGEEGAEWVEPFLDELCTFPNATNDDQVDAFADAYNDLAARARYTLDNL